MQGLQILGFMSISRSKSLSFAIRPTTLKIYIFSGHLILLNYFMINLLSQNEWSDSVNCQTDKIKHSHSTRTLMSARMSGNYKLRNIHKM